MASSLKQFSNVSPSSKEETQQTTVVSLSYGQNIENLALEISRAFYLTLFIFHVIIIKSHSRKA